MRRIIGGSAAFLALTGTLLVLPVYAAPVPAPEPVATSVDEVSLGSVVDPEPGKTELDSTIAYRAQHRRIGAVPRVPAIARHPRRSTANRANRVGPAPIRSKPTGRSSDC